MSLCDKSVKDIPGFPHDLEDLRNVTFENNLEKSVNFKILSNVMEFLHYLHVLVHTLNPLSALTVLRQSESDF